MKVGLINSNKRGFKEKDVPPVPPIGLEYLIDELTKDQHEISFLDLCFYEEADEKALIEEFSKDKDIIGVTFRNFGVDNYWIEESEQFFVDRLKVICLHIRNSSKAKIVVGGQGFSLFPNEILAHTNADYGIVGPGELAFKKLIKQMDSSDKKVYYGEYNTEIVHARDLIDYDKYLKHGGAPAIQTKIGCALPCSFCVESRKRIQKRTISYVIEELKTIIKKSNGFIFIADAEFNSNLKQAIEFCGEVINNKIKFRWSTYINPIPLSEELVRLMKMSGCENPCISVSSGNDLVLNSFNTRFSKDRILEITSWFHKYNLPFTVDLIFGGVNDNLESASETIRLMEVIKPTIVGMNCGVRIYPRTGIASALYNNKLDYKHLYGKTSNNDNLFKPIYYISDIKVWEYLKEVSDSYPNYFLLGYNQFGGINYKKIELINA